MIAYTPQRFVYVEDRPDDRELLAEEFFGMRHWNEVRCLDGVAAFRRYLDDPETPAIDVLIVDWRLKDGTGADVIQLAVQHPKGKQAAVLAVSVVSEAAQIAEADRARAHYFLEKPLTVNLIKDTLVKINGFGEVIVRKKRQ